MCDLYDLYGLAHVAGWEPCNLRSLFIGHVSWVGYVLYRCSRAIFGNGLLGAIDLDDPDDLSVGDLSLMWKVAADKHGGFGSTWPRAFRKYLRSTSLWHPLRYRENDCRLTIPPVCESKL